MVHASELWGRPFCEMFLQSNHRGSWFKTVFVGKARDTS